MKYSSLPFQWVLFIFLIHATWLSEAQSMTMMIPRLSPTERTTFDNQATMAASDTGDFQKFYYNQTLDHFNYRHESYTKFPQRYYINFKYWGGANSSAPIFAYLGAEGKVDDPSNSSIGFLTENAASFNALVVFMEHRYYGESVPFGSRQEAMKNASTRGYFNSAQAIADYAAILRCIKRTYNARKSPVIVIGGSYGGMLASWFRLKYPHLALGALASSAPVLYFDKITPQNGYYSVVTKDFREASETCYETILNSWSDIENEDLSSLSRRFNTCQPLKSSYELIWYLVNMYAGAAQYDFPYHRVTTICAGIDGGSFGNDTLSRIYAGVVARFGNNSCKVNPPTNGSEPNGWAWQTCSEMVMPIGGGNDTMFPVVDPFDLEKFMKDCKQRYEVWPRPHWVTTYYGGHHIKLVLKRFGSNIIFSNGLKDPYSIGGVLHNISDSIVAISTVNGSHCLDILRANPHNDPQWLIEQRRQEVEIIKGWIDQYYDDLSPPQTYLKLKVDANEIQSI